MRRISFITIALVATLSAKAGEEILIKRDLVENEAYSISSYLEIGKQCTNINAIFLLKKQPVKGKKKIMWIKTIESVAFLGKNKGALTKLMCASSIEGYLLALFGECIDFIRYKNNEIYIVGVKWNAFSLSEYGVTVSVYKVNTKITPINGAKKSKILELCQSTKQLHDKRLFEPKNKRLEEEYMGLKTQLDKLLNLQASKAYLSYANNNRISPVGLYPRSLQLSLKDDKIYIYVNGENGKNKIVKFMPNTIPNEDDIFAYALVYDIKRNIIGNFKKEEKKNAKNSNSQQAQSHNDLIKTRLFLSNNLVLKALEKNVLGLKKLEKVDRSDVALIFLSRLPAALRNDFEFGGFKELYGRCVANLAPPWEPAVSERTLALWRSKKGDLRKIMDDMYVAFDGDRLLPPLFMFDALFALRKHALRKPPAPSEKGRIEQFIRSYAEEVLKRDPTQPLRTVLEALKSGKELSEDAEKEINALASPPAPVEFEPSRGRGAKLVDGVPARYLTALSCRSPEEFGKRVAELREIEDKRKASNLAVVYLANAAPLWRWLDEGKLSAAAYMDMMDALFARLDRGAPISGEVRKHWSLYSRRLRRKVFSRFITYNMLPVYFRTVILAELRARLSKRPDAPDAAEIAEFIRKEAADVLKSFPPNPDMAALGIIKDNPLISDRELHDAMRKKFEKLPKN